MVWTTSTSSHPTSAYILATRSAHSSMPIPSWLELGCLSRRLTLEMCLFLSLSILSNTPPSFSLPDMESPRLCIRTIKRFSGAQRKAMKYKQRRAGQR